MFRSFSMSATVLITKILTNDRLHNAPSNLLSFCFNDLVFMFTPYTIVGAHDGNILMIYFSLIFTLMTSISISLSWAKHENITHLGMKPLGKEFNKK